MAKIWKRKICVTGARWGIYILWRLFILWVGISSTESILNLNPFQQQSKQIIITWLNSFWTFRIGFKLFSVPAFFNTVTVSHIIWLILPLVINWNPLTDIDESDEPSDINTEIKINMRRSYVDESYLPKLETSITKGTRSLIRWNSRPIKIRLIKNEQNWMRLS